MSKREICKMPCYYMEMFLFKILKNCVSIQSMQNGDEWKTQEKKKKNRLETLKDIYNADTTKNLLEG